MRKLCSACGSVSETDGAFCATCGASYNRQGGTSRVVAGSAPQSNSELPQVNPVFSWTNIGFGSLGVLGTFLPYAGDSEDTVNGWDSADLLGDLDQYSSGTLMALLFAGTLLAAGIVSLTELGTKQSTKGFGWGSIVCGLFALGSAHATFLAWDSAAQDAGIFVEMGTGLYIAYLVGIVLIVVGILSLALPTYHRKSRVVE